ncbi:MAG: tetratricopeptide repeat protein [Desulfobacula sp.]|jgi:tetratricopeptide (TPR) repeat protein
MKIRFLKAVPSFLLLLLFFSFLVFSCSSPEKDISTHLIKAEKYFNEKKFEEAKIEYQNVIQLDPKHDTAHFELGETYVHLQDPVKAAASFSQAVTANPDNLKARLRLGQILLLAKETKQARDAVNVIFQKHPDNVEAMHLLASIQIQERNLPLAVKTLEKTIDLAPSDPRTYLFLAHLLFVMNRPDEAEPYYLKTIELDNTLRAPYMELISLYNKKGEIGKIEPLINQWVKVPGDQVQKSNDLAHFQESQGRPEQAEKTYIEASLNAPNNSDALVNLGSFYARQKKNGKALEVFLQALTLDKQNPDIQASIATLSFEEKKYEESEKTVDIVLGKDPLHVQGNFLKGRLYIEKKDFAAALKHFDSVIGSAPDHAAARYFKAICLLDKGKSDLPGQDLFRVAAGYKTAESWERKLAKDELTRVVEIDPGFINARLLLIDINIEDKEIGSAKQNILTVLQKDPQNIQALILEGKLKLLENDLTGAEKIYLAILERQPDFASGYVSLGLALNGMKKTKEALDALDKALNINPNQMDALNYKVSIHMQKKEVEKAIDACEKHRLKFEPTASSIAVIDLIQGKIFMSTGKIEKAEDFFKKAIERLPALSSPYEELGAVYEYKKNIALAIESYEKLLKLNPGYLPTYLNLSRIYKNQGDLKKSQKYLTDALAIQADYAPAANNLAFLMAENKSSLYEALRLAKIARDKDPKNPDYLDTLGWIYYLQGSHGLALRELEESLSINPKNPITHYHIGWTYYETQKFEEARNHMAKALELDPEFKGADKARDVLGK